VTVKRFSPVVVMFFISNVFTSVVDRQLLHLLDAIYLATEALSDSFEFIGAIEISLSIYPARQG